MILKKYFLYFLILIFFISCNKEEKKLFEITEINSHLDVEVNIERERDIHAIRYPFIGSAGNNILIYGISAEKNRTYMVYIYDPDLNLIKSNMIPEGQGPGDIAAMSILYAKDHLIYAIDKTNMRITVFNSIPQINLQQCIKLNEDGIFYGPRLSGDFKYIAFSKFNFEGYINKATNNIICAHFPSFSNAIKYEEIVSGKLRINNKSILGNEPLADYFFRKNYLYVLNMRDYSLSKYSIKDSTFWRVKIKFNKIRIDKNDKGKILEGIVTKKYLHMYELPDSLLPTSWMLPLNKGFVVIRRKNLNQTPTSDIIADYFDYELNMIGKINIPYFFRYNIIRFPSLNHFTCFINGYLYVISDKNENWQVQKWRIDEPGARNDD